MKKLKTAGAGVYLPWNAASGHDRIKWDPTGTCGVKPKMEKSEAAGAGVHLPERTQAMYNWIESIETRTRKQEKHDKNNTTSIYIKRLIRDEIARKSAGQ